MRYVRQAGSDPAFLLKALGEASGEFRRAIDGIPRRYLIQPGRDQDDCWTLLGVLAHVRDVELGVAEQVETIIAKREPDIRHVGVDDIPFREDYEDEDEDDLLQEFHYYRRSVTYTLWDLPEPAWDRGGIHPYRGRVTVRDLVRELYQHDLEHLWQARRMIESLR
ncbi:MAG: DinB family protein [Dehalococcoidia bacterium]